MREIGRADSRKSPIGIDGRAFLQHFRICRSADLGKRVGRAACGFRSALHTRPIRLPLIPIAQIWELTSRKTRTWSELQRKGGQVLSTARIRANDARGDRRFYRERTRRDRMSNTRSTPNSTGSKSRSFLGFVLGDGAAAHTNPFMLRDGLRYVNRACGMTLSARNRPCGFPKISDWHRRACALDGLFESARPLNWEKRDLGARESISLHIVRA